jgi:hypothetical protein
MNILEKIVGAVIILVMAIFMIPTILGIVLTTLPSDVGFIIVFCIVLGVITVPILIFRHKGDDLK